MPLFTDILAVARVIGQRAEDWVRVVTIAAYSTLMALILASAAGVDEFLIFGITLGIWIFVMVLTPLMIIPIVGIGTIVGEMISGKVKELRQKIFTVSGLFMVFGLFFAIVPFWARRGMVVFALAGGILIITRIFGVQTDDFKWIGNLGGTLLLISAIVPISTVWQNEEMQQDSIIFSLFDGGDQSPQGAPQPQSPTTTLAATPTTIPYIVGECAEDEDSRYELDWETVGRKLVIRDVPANCWTPWIPASWAQGLPGSMGLDVEFGTMSQMLDIGGIKTLGEPTAPRAIPYMAFRLRSDDVPKDITIRWGF